MRKAKALLLHTVYGKTSEGKAFVVFTPFSLNYESFPVNHGLVEWQYKSTKCYSKLYIMEVFSLKIFAVYSMLHSMEALLLY